MKKILCLIFSLFMMFSFSSCSKMEIDKTAIVSSLYIYGGKSELWFCFNTVENESASLLPRYTVSADSLAEAKARLQQTGVNYLFLGQLECVVLSDSLTLDNIRSCLGYFAGGYECSPGAAVLFAEEKALLSLLSDEVSQERLYELIDVIKKQSPDAALTVYSLYNGIKNYPPDAPEVGFLVQNGELKAISRQLFAVSY